MLSTVPIFVVCHTLCALKMNEVGSITLVVELVREKDRSGLLDCLLIYSQTAKGHRCYLL